MLNKTVLLIALLGLIACHKTPTPPVRAMYHWRTALSLSAADRQFLDSLGVTRLYVKFFDVDWAAEQQTPLPAAELQVDTSFLHGLDLCPVVFITNQTLVRIPKQEIPNLAKHLVDKVYDLHVPLHAFPIRELQLDCDWTDSTREAYFELLTQIRGLVQKDSIALSATIRLHQLRYPKRTGIPPVDRGMLMFYNMGDVEDWQESNSILNLEKGRPYLKNAHRYPLPLDAALPAYTWGVLFRDGRLTKLIYPMDAGALADTARFSKLAPQRWEVVKSTYLEGHYLYRGDKLRVEDVSVSNLYPAATMLGQALPMEQRCLALYHLDTLLRKRYTHAQLDTAYRNFYLH